MDPFDKIIDHMQSQARGRSSLALQFDPTLGQWTAVYGHGEVDDPNTPTQSHASVAPSLNAALGQIASEL
jgi:hypothetical protein